MRLPVPFTLSTDVALLFTGVDAGAAVVLNIDVATLWCFLVRVGTAAAQVVYVWCAMGGLVLRFGSLRLLAAVDVEHRHSLKTDPFDADFSRARSRETQCEQNEYGARSWTHLAWCFPFFLRGMEWPLKKAASFVVCVQNLRKAK
jgi:hypothetical protein